MFYTEFASASPNFIKWIQKKNEELTGVRGHITKAQKSSTYLLKYAKVESLAIINAMYYQPGLISLSRKKLKMAGVFDTMGLSVKHLQALHDS